MVLKNSKTFLFCTNALCWRWVVGVIWYGIMQRQLLSAKSINTGNSNRLQYMIMILFFWTEVIREGKAGVQGQLVRQLTIAISVNYLWISLNNPRNQLGFSWRRSLDSGPCNYSANDARVGVYVCLAYWNNTPS